MQRRRDVRHRNTGQRRPAVVAERHAQQSRDRLDGEIVRGPIAIRTRVAERVDRSNRRCAALRRRDGLVADAEALGRPPAGTTRRTRRRSHTTAAGSRGCARPSSRARRSSCRGSSCGRTRSSARRQAPMLPRRIAVGRLDLDDLGAMIGEREREIRARQEHREIDDAQTRKLHRRRRRPDELAEQRFVVRAERRARRRLGALRRPS